MALKRSGYHTIWTGVEGRHIATNGRMTSIVKPDIRLERYAVERVPEIVVGRLAQYIPADVRGRHEAAVVVTEAADEAMVGESPVRADVQDSVGEGASLDAALENLRDGRE